MANRPTSHSLDRDGVLRSEHRKTQREALATIGGSQSATHTQIRSQSASPAPASRAGTLRIYGGDVTSSTTNDGIKYKGIAVTTSTTAKEVIDTVMERFGVKQTSDYEIELRYVKIKDSDRRRRGVFRRDRPRKHYILRPTECPLLLADCFDDERRFQLFWAERRKSTGKTAAVLPATQPDCNAESTKICSTTNTRPASASKVSRDVVDECKPQFDFLVRGKSLENMVTSVDDRDESASEQPIDQRTLKSKGMSATSDSGPVESLSADIKQERADKGDDALKSTPSISSTSSSPQRTKLPYGFGRFSTGGQYRPPPPPAPIGSVFPYLVRTTSSAMDDSKINLSNSMIIGSSPEAQLRVDEAGMRSLHCRLVLLGCDVAVAPINGADLLIDGVLIHVPVTVRNNAILSFGTQVQERFRIAGACCMRTVPLEAAAARELFPTVMQQTKAEQHSTAHPDVSEISCRPNTASSGSRLSSSICQNGCDGGPASSTPVPSSALAAPQCEIAKAQSQGLLPNPALLRGHTFCGSQSATSTTTKTPPLVGANGFMPPSNFLAPNNYGTPSFYMPTNRNVPTHQSAAIGATQLPCQTTVPLASSIPSDVVGYYPGTAFRPFPGYPQMGFHTLPTTGCDVNWNHANPVYLIQYFNATIQNLLFQKAQLPGVANKRKRQKINSKVEVLVKKREAIRQQIEIGHSWQLPTQPQPQPVLQLSQAHGPDQDENTSIGRGLNANAPVFHPSHQDQKPSIDETDRKTPSSESSGSCEDNTSASEMDSYQEHANLLNDTSSSTRDESDSLELAHDTASPFVPAPKEACIDLEVFSDLSTTSELGLADAMDVSLSLSGLVKTQSAFTHESPSTEERINSHLNPMNQSVERRKQDNNNDTSSMSDTKNTQIRGWSSVVSSPKHSEGSSSPELSPRARRKLTVLSAKGAQSSPLRHYERRSAACSTRRSRIASSSENGQGPVSSRTMRNDILDRESTHSTANDKENTASVTGKSKRKHHADAPVNWRDSLKPTGIRLVGTPKTTTTSRLIESPGGVVETKLNLAAHGLRVTGLLQKPDHGKVMKLKDDSPDRRREKMGFKEKRAMWMKL